MKVTVKIQGKEQAFDKLRQYAELTGNAIETGVKEIGVETARALAHKVQPFGFKKIEKFEGSIRKQVKRAIRAANVDGDTSNMASAHKSRRNKKGQVPKDLKQHGHYPKKPFDPQQRARYGEAKAKNAGMAKGAWVEAGNKLITQPSKSRRALKPIKVGETVMRHADKENGLAKLRRSGINLVIYLTNKLSYIRRTMKNGHIEAAVKKGQVKGYKRIDMHIKRETKRLTKI